MIGSISSTCARFAIGALLAVSTLHFGCAGAGAALGNLAMQAGRSFLTNTAEKNFGTEYQDSFSKMVDLMMFKTAAGETSGHAMNEPAVAPASEESRPPETAADDPASSEVPLAAVEDHAPVTPKVPLELNVSVLREVVHEGRPIPVPVEDGEVLRDGVGRSSTGDNLKIQFTATSSCYVYAVWIDATAWATPIFPASVAGTFDNPVQAGRTYSIPAGGDWWYLDDYRGVENLYFVASHEPLAELGASLASFVGREREFRSGVTEVALNDEPVDIGRGLGGMRPGRASLVQASDGSSHQVAGTSFVAELAGGDMVVHRWFEHR